MTAYADECETCARCHCGGRYCERDHAECPYCAEDDRRAEADCG